MILVEEAKVEFCGMYTNPRVNKDRGLSKSVFNRYGVYGSLGFKGIVSDHRSELALARNVTTSKSSRCECCCHLYIGLLITLGRWNVWEIWSLLERLEAEPETSTYCGTLH